LAASRVMTVPNLWLKWANLTVQNFEKTEKPISRFLWWTSIYARWWFFTTLCCFCSKKILTSFMSKNSMSLQTACQIFVKHLARLGSWISHWLWCSYQLHKYDVPDCISLSVDIYFTPNHSYSVDLSALPFHPWVISMQQPLSYLNTARAAVQKPTWRLPPKAIDHLHKAPQKSRAGKPRRSNL
jgi:hypothetical protein